MPTEDEYRKREREVPMQLVKLATARGANPWDITPLSAFVVLEVLNKHLAGHTTLDEMQVEMIVALAARCDELQKLLRDDAMLRLLSPSS